MLEFAKPTDVARLLKLWSSPLMSLETLKQEAAGLSGLERKELIGFLLSLNRDPREREEFAREMTEKMNCKDPGRWLTLEELKARLDKIPEPTDG